MNWEPALNLLVQVPLVGMFVWFVLEMDKRNKASQDKRDALYVKSLASIANVLTELKSCFDRHDDHMNQALEAMEKARGKDAK